MCTSHDSTSPSQHLHPHCADRTRGTQSRSCQIMSKPELFGVQTQESSLPPAPLPKLTPTSPPPKFRLQTSFAGVEGKRDRHVRRRNEGCPNKVLLYFSTIKIKKIFLILKSLWIHRKLQRVQRSPTGPFFSFLDTGRMMKT